MTLKRLTLVNSLITVATGFSLVLAFTTSPTYGFAFAMFGFAWLIRGKVDSLWFTAALEQLVETIQSSLCAQTAEQEAVLAALDDLIRKFGEEGSTS